MKKILLTVLAISLVVVLGCGKEARPPGQENVDASKNIVVVDSNHSTILGFIIGHMDQYDKEKLGYALEYANPNDPFEWENPQNKNKYRVTLFSKDVGEKKGCKMVEIFSAQKRLKACAEFRLDPEKGWLLKSQL